MIGWPVAHSRSPPMQNAALAALELDLVYLAFAVAPERLAEAVRGAAALGVRGLNVTLPHKEAALALCEPDAVARAVGAVNTLAFEDGAVRGTNTDVHGFTRLLEEAAIPSGRALVLGVGGAARAVVAALAARGDEITLASRRPSRLEVADRAFHTRGWDELPALLAGCDLLVDATPRGLDDGLTPLDLSPLGAHARVVDLAVRRETPLVRAARARGLGAHTGEAMLVHQGAAALERWTGRPAPLEIMRRALAQAL